MLLRDCIEGIFGVVSAAGEFLGEQFAGGVFGFGEEGFGEHDGGFVVGEAFDADVSAEVGQTG